MKTYDTGIKLKDLFGKKRMTDMAYQMRAQKAKADEEIQMQKEIIGAQATVISMLCNEVRSYKEDPFAENERLRRELDRANASQHSLQEYAEDLERKLGAKKLKEVS